MELLEYMLWQFQVHLLKGHLHPWAKIGRISKVLWLRNFFYEATVLISLSKQTRLTRLTDLRHTIDCIISLW